MPESVAVGVEMRGWMLSDASSRCDQMWGTVHRICCSYQVCLCNRLREEDPFSWPPVICTTVRISYSLLPEGDDKEQSKPTKVQKTTCWSIRVRHFILGLISLSHSVRKGLMKWVWSSRKAFLFVLVYRTPNLVQRLLSFRNSMQSQKGFTHNDNSIKLPMRLIFSHLGLVTYVFWDWHFRKELAVFLMETSYLKDKLL